MIKDFYIQKESLNKVIEYVKSCRGGSFYGNKNINIFSDDELYVSCSHLIVHNKIYYTYRTSHNLFITLVYSLGTRF